MEDNVYTLPGCDDEEFICRGCLAEGVIADALEETGCPPELVEETADAVSSALLRAGLL